MTPAELDLQETEDYLLLREKGAPMMSRQHFDPDFEATEGDFWKPIPTWKIWLVGLSIPLATYSLGLLFGAAWEWLR